MTTTSASTTAPSTVPTTVASNVTMPTVPTTTVISRPFKYQLFNAYLLLHSNCNSNNTDTLLCAGIKKELKTAYFLKFYFFNLKLAYRAILFALFFASL